MILEHLHKIADITTANISKLKILLTFLILTFFVDQFLFFLLDVLFTDKTVNNFNTKYIYIFLTFISSTSISKSQTWH